VPWGTILGLFARPLGYPEILYIRTAMSDARLECPFLCPLCGSNEYVFVVFPRKNGTAYLTNLYQCGGCTVAFTDPECFTKLYRSTFDRARHWREVRATKDVPKDS
jgi:hypothetical protein